MASKSTKADRATRCAHVILPVRIDGFVVDASVKTPSRPKNRRNTKIRAIREQTEA